MDKIIYFIGQSLGVVTVLLGFISYQMKSQKKLLLAQAITCLVFAIHFLILGAWSGMALNIVSTVRDFTFYHRYGKGNSGKALPIFFTVVMAIVGILTWEAWYSVFVFLGIVIHTFCMSFSDAQNVRKSILITSPLVLIYDVFVHSWGGIVYESVAVISSVVGIIRYQRNKKSSNS